VFGKKDENGRYTGEILGALRNHWNESSKKFFPAVKNAVKGGAIGVVSGATLSQMGLLGGALATGLGGPIGMGLMGLGLGIASTTDKFNDWMFGTEYEKDGKKFREKDGFLQRSTNMLRSELIDPLAMAFKHNLRNFGDWVQTAISIPFRRSVGPIIDTIKSSILKIKSDISDWIKDMIADFSNFIKQGFDRVVKSIFTPIGRAISKVGRGIMSAAKLGAKIAASPLTLGLKATEIMTAPLRSKEQSKFYKAYYTDLITGKVGESLKANWKERKARGEHVGILDKLHDRVDSLFMKGDVADARYEGFVQSEEDQGRNVANWLRLGRKSKKIKEESKIRDKEYKQYLAFNKEASKIRRAINNIETTQLTDKAFKDYKNKLASTGFNKRYMDKIKTNEDMMEAIFHTSSFMDKIDNPEKYKTTGEEMLEAETQQTEELKNVSSNTASILDILTQSYRLRFNAEAFKSRPEAIQNEILKQRERAGKTIKGLLTNGVYQVVNREGQTETYKKKEIMKLLNDNRLIQYNLGGIDKKLIDSYLGTRTKDDEKDLSEGFYEYISTNKALKENNNYFKEIESWIPDIVRSARFGIGGEVFSSGAIFGKNGAPGQFKLIVKAIYDDVYNNINSYESFEDVKNKLHEKFKRVGIKVSDAIVEAFAKAIYKQTKATIKYAGKDMASTAINTISSGIETGKKVAGAAVTKGKGVLSSAIGGIKNLLGKGLGYGNISIPGIDLDAPLGFGKGKKYYKWLENKKRQEYEEFWESVDIDNFYSKSKIKEEKEREKQQKETTVSSFEQKLRWEAAEYLKQIKHIMALYSHGKIDALRVREMVDAAIYTYHQGIERQDDWKKILKLKNEKAIIENLSKDDLVYYYNEVIKTDPEAAKGFEKIKHRYVNEKGEYVGDEEFFKLLTEKIDNEQSEEEVMKNLLAGIYVATSGGGDPKKISKATDLGIIGSYINKHQKAKIKKEIEEGQSKFIQQGTGKLNRTYADTVDLASQFRNFKGRNLERLGKVKQGASELFDIFKETRIGKMLGGSLSFLIRGFLLSTLGLSAMDFITDSRFGKNLTNLSKDFANKINSNGLYQSYIDPVISSVTGSIKAWADRAADEEGSVGNYIGKKVTEKMETGINYLVTGSEKAGEFIPKYIENYFIPSAERISEVVANNAGNIVKIAGNVLLPLTKAMIFEITPMAIKTAASIGKSVMLDGVDRVFGGIENPFNTEVTGRYVKGMYLARNAAKNGSTFARNLLRVPGNIIGGTEGAVLSGATKAITKNPLALGVRKLGQLGGFWTADELAAFDKMVGTRNLMKRGASIGGDITSGNFINLAKSGLNTAGNFITNHNLIRVVDDKMASEAIEKVLSQRIMHSIENGESFDNVDDIMKNLMKNEKDDILKQASKNLGSRITNFNVVDDEVKASITYIGKLKNGIIKALENFRNSKVFNSLIGKLGIKGEKIIPELIELFTKNFNLITSKIPGNALVRKGLSKAIPLCAKGARSLLSGVPAVGEVLMAYSGFAGASAGSTANLFRVSAEDVTPTMRLVSAIINFFESTLLGIAFILFDTLGRIVGIDIRGLAAKLIYKLIPWTDEADYEALANKQSEFEKELEHYNEVTGKDLSVEEYNDMMNKGWISSIIDKLKPGESERDKALKIAQEGGYAKSDAEIKKAKTQHRMTAIQDELADLGTGDINTTQFNIRDGNKTSVAFNAAGLAGALDDIPVMDINSPEDVGRYQLVLMKRQLQELMIIRRSLVQSNNNSVKIQAIQNKQFGDTFDKITTAMMFVNPIAGAAAKTARYLYTNRNTTNTKPSTSGTKLSVSTSDMTNSIMNKYGDLGEGIGYGNMYDQNNPEYANIPIGYFPNGKISTIKSGGCGAVALSKVINDVYGYGPVDPISVANVSKSLGGISEGGTNEIGLTAVANKFGVESARLRNGKELVNSLRTGHPVIMAGQDSRGSTRTPFTPGKHIVSMKGIMRDKNNNFYTTVLDSNTGKYGRYKIKDLASKASHAFAYGRRRSIGHGNVSGNVLGYGLEGLSMSELVNNKSNTKNKEYIINALIQTALDEKDYKQKSGPDVPMDSKSEYIGTPTQKYTKYARDLDSINFYGSKIQGLDWCDVFVDWCFVKTFGPEKAIELTGGTSALCSQSYTDYVNMGNAPVAPPEKGDQIFFKEHTGLVYKVDDNTVYTIEGNCTLGNSRGVVTRTYSRSSRDIIGYGRPKWECVSNVNPYMFNNANTNDDSDSNKTPIYSFEEFKRELRGKSWFAKLQMYAKLVQAQFNALMGSGDLWYEYNVLIGAIDSDENGSSSNTSSSNNTSFKINSLENAQNISDELLGLTQQLTNANESGGRINTVVANDVKGPSIGTYQAHGGNYTNLLKQLANSNVSSDLKNIFNKYASKDPYVALTSDEAKELSNALGNAEYKDTIASIMNTEQLNLIRGYYKNLTHLYDNNTIRDIKALPLLADLANIGPAWVGNNGRLVSDWNGSRDLAYAKDRALRVLDSMYANRINNDYNTLKDYNFKFTAKPGELSTAMGFGFNPLGYGIEDDPNKEMKARNFQKLKNSFSSIGEYMSGWLANKGLMGDTSLSSTDTSLFSDGTTNNVSNNYNSANVSYDPSSTVFPLSSGYEHSGISATFPYYSSGRHHNGVDFVPYDGSTPYVVAAKAGTVYRVNGEGSSYGNHVTIIGDDGVGYVYAHMAGYPRVKAGDRVGAGTILGVMGSTGNSTGPHLHFEVRTKPRAGYQNDYNSAIDPLPLLGIKKEKGAIQRLGSGNLTDEELRTLGLSTDNDLYKLDSINNMGDYHFDNSTIFDTPNINKNNNSINNINIEDEETVNKLEKIISIMLEWHKDSIKGTNAQLALANKNIKVINNTNNTFNNNQVKENREVNPTKYKDTIINQHAILAYRSNLKKDI